MADDRLKDMTRLYQKASGELRRVHNEEFHSILGRLYEEEGIVVRPRRSKERMRRDNLEAARRLLESDTPEK